MRDRPGAARRTAARRLSATALVVATAGLLTACGTPDYQFVANDDRDVVMKVPRSWNRLDTRAVLGAQGLGIAPGGWIAYYDASSTPSASHLRLANATAPVMTALSGNISAQDRSGITKDVLTDFFVPVTATARSTDTITRAAQGQEPRTFKLVSNQDVTSSTERGVHVVFSYTTTAGVEYFDQIAVTDPKKTRVHAVMVRCTQACYRQHGQEIGSAVESLTVKK